MAIQDSNKQTRNKIKGEVNSFIKSVQPDVDKRKKNYKIRRDMFSGNHKDYTNVVGLTKKQQAGHVQPVFNYVNKLARHLQRKVTVNGFRFRIVSEDESNEIENLRAEELERVFEDIIYDNQFNERIFKRGTLVQVRDADFAIKCVVNVDEGGEKNIEITNAEDMSKLYVLWDDSSGSSFSKIAYVDEWSVEKVRREFPDIDEDILESATTEIVGSEVGQHTDEYGVHSGGSNSNMDLSYGAKNKKLRVVDYWGEHKVKDEMTGEMVVKVVNMVLVGKGEDSVEAQYAETDYRRIPWHIGHCEPNPGNPWSEAFIDKIFDANIELNDRTGEEGDLVREGANKKYTARNMDDFDPKSISTSSSQVIFLDEDSEFSPIPDTTNVFPSESYKESMLDHIFNLSMPKVALSAGSGPYTGRAGAFQFQPIADLVEDLRGSWRAVMTGLFIQIQEYLIDFFPEYHPILRESVLLEDGTYTEGDLIVRKMFFDFDSPTPLSRSDRVVDATTLYDRKVLPTRMYLEEAGFNDPNRIIKELKKEWKDEELVPIKTQLEELSEAVRTLSATARREQLEQQEQIDLQSVSGTGQKPGGPIASRAGEGETRRSAPSTSGVPISGQVATMEGMNRQVQQNTNASRGI